jgi:pilus assembly protein CpaE
MDALRFIIIDDSDSYREILRELVHEQPDWTVEDEAGDGATAVSLAEQLRPDVVLIDINIPIMRGIAATRRIKQLAPKTCVITMSAYDDEEFRRGSYSAGADYFFRKEDINADSLAATVTTICANL